MSIKRFFKKIILNKHFKKYLTLIGGLVIIIIIFLIISGWWPVAIVNGQIITFSNFSKNYNIAYRFYQNELKLNQKNTSLLDSEATKAEMRRAVLESIIENYLFSQELNRQLNSDDLTKLIDNKINKFDLDSERFKRGVDLLYGLKPDDFKQLILVPKAKEEILRGRLFLENKNFNDWLTAQKKEAKVIIFVPGLYWNQSGVEFKK